MSKKLQKKNWLPSIIAIAVVLLLSLTGVFLFYFYNWWLQSPHSIDWNSSFKRGELQVYFKTESTENQARELLQKYSLSPKYDAIFFKYPQATFHFSGRELETTLNKVRQLEFVSSVESTINTDDALTTGHKAFVVMFKKYVSKDEINSIAALSPDIIVHEPLGKLEIIVVPVGQEKEIVDKIKNEPIIKTIRIEYLPLPQR